MNKDNRSTSYEEVQALFNQNPKYRKAERLVSVYYELATKIINLRTSLNLTQKDLALKAETYQSRVSKIESGEHDVRLSTLTKIAEALQSRVVIDLVPVWDELEFGNEPYKILFPNATVAPEVVQFSTDYLSEDKIRSIATTNENAH